MGFYFALVSLLFTLALVILSYTNIIRIFWEFHLPVREKRPSLLVLLTWLSSPSLMEAAYSCMLIPPQRKQIVDKRSSVQFTRSVMSVSDSLWPHESHHARPPCSSLSPGVHSDSCPSSLWCHLAISCLVVPFSSCPQSLPASEFFPMSQLFAWGGQSTGVSALAPFLPKKSQGWSPLEWTGWSPCSPRDSQESSPTS